MVVDLVVALESVSTVLVMARVVVDATVVVAFTSQFLILHSSKGSQSNCSNSTITSWQEAPEVASLSSIVHMSYLHAQMTKNEKATATLMPKNSQKQ